MVGSGAICGDGHVELGEGTANNTGEGSVWCVSTICKADKDTGISGLLGLGGLIGDTGVGLLSTRYKVGLQFNKI